MPGLYFDEFSVGRMIDHPIRRTLTEADNVPFTSMTRSPAALHLDAGYMKYTGHGRPIVNLGRTGVTDFRDLDGLRDSELAAPRDGFSGMLAIPPERSRSTIRRSGPATRRSKVRGASSSCLRKTLIPARSAWTAKCSTGRI